MIITRVTIDLAWHVSQSKPVKYLFKQILLSSANQTYVLKNVCTEEIKTTCANSTSTCGLSVENSRLATQTVSKYLYKHEFYLSQSDSNASSDLDDDPPKKCNYLDLTYVLPSAICSDNFKF